MSCVLLCLRNIDKCVIVVQESDKYAWANASHSILYTYTAQAIKLALSKGLMQKPDLWRLSDEAFWAQFVCSPDPDVRRLAAKVRADVSVTLVDGDTALGGDPYSDEGEVLQCSHKLRTLDPDIALPGGGVKKLSELDEGYRAIRAEYLSSNSGPKRCAWLALSLFGYVLTLLCSI